MAPRKVTTKRLKSNPGRHLRGNICMAGLPLALALAACGPRARIPRHPLAVPDRVADSAAVAVLARSLAPVLYLQADESFPLERVVAVVHPARRVIAYHLLWRDDVHGAWIPFTRPTDQEIVWVGYDEAARPTTLWTFWHGDILRAEWRDKGTPAADVQWGKHGSLPHETIAGDLRFPRTMELFWLAAWLGIPDFALGRLNRKGPLCFCHGYRRYGRFPHAVPLASRLDAIVRTDDPAPALRAVFGRNYSRKQPWP